MTETLSLQAMNLISIAQQSGDVSADMYVKYSGMGPIQPPSMAGVEQLVAKMQQETQNPFLANGFPSAEKPPLGPERGSRPPVLGIPAGPSPRSSQASSFCCKAQPLQVEQWKTQLQGKGCLPGQARIFDKMQKQKTGVFSYVFSDSSTL